MMEEELTNEETKAIQEDLDEHMKLIEKQRNEFLNHLDNNICQKCGKKTSYFRYVGLDCHFDDEGIVIKEDGKIQQARVKKHDLEFLNCRPSNCVVLCDKCHKDLLMRLNISIQDAMNIIEG